MPNNHEDTLMDVPQKSLILHDTTIGHRLIGNNHWDDTINILVIIAQH